MINKQKGNIELYKDKKWLYNKYWNEKHTLMEMNKLADCCYVTLWKWMKKYNIKRRTHKESYNPIDGNHIKLNNKSIEFFDGLLLGDGCLTIGSFRSAYYSHGDKNLNYIKWLSKEFDKFGIKGKFRKYKYKNAYMYKSLSYIELYELAKKWYPNGKKKIPYNLIISPNILKNWYIGDGNFSRQPLIDSTIFSINDLKRICNQLNKLGFEFSLRVFKDRKRIRIKSKSEKDFFSYILLDDNTIPTNYKYKFPKEILR